MVEPIVLKGRDSKILPISIIAVVALLVLGGLLYFSPSFVGKAIGAQVGVGSMGLENANVEGVVVERVAAGDSFSVKVFMNTDQPSRVFSFQVQIPDGVQPLAQPLSEMEHFEYHTTGLVGDNEEIILEIVGVVLPTYVANDGNSGLFGVNEIAELNFQSEVDGTYRLDLIDAHALDYGGNELMTNFIQDNSAVAIGDAQFGACPDEGEVLGCDINEGAQCLGQSTYGVCVLDDINRCYKYEAEQCRASNGGVDLGEACVDAQVGCEDRDADGDGQASDEMAGGDCDDGNPLINSNVAEFCGDEIDNNCNGEVDEAGCSIIDTDGDGIAEDVDLCPLVPSSEPQDANENGVGDSCEGCYQLSFESSLSERNVCTESLGDLTVNDRHDDRECMGVYKGVVITRKFLGEQYGGPYLAWLISDGNQASESVRVGELCPEFVAQNPALWDVGPLGTLPVDGSDEGLSLMKECISEAGESHSMYSAACEAGVAGGDDGGVIPGDVNGDGNINIIDATALVGCVLEREGAICRDINCDGSVNVIDVTILINSVLGREGAVLQLCAQV